MNNYDFLKQVELQEACNRLKSAMLEAHRVETYGIQRKGKTLYSVNRSRQSTVKMTVGGK